MAMVFFGQLTTRQSRRVYLPDMSVAPKALSWCRLTYLAPIEGQHAVASFYHWLERKHCIFAWREDGFAKERKIILPGLLRWQVALELAREEFPNIVPSPIIFRLDNYRQPWLYE